MGSKTGKIGGPRRPSESMVRLAAQSDFGVGIKSELALQGSPPKIRFGSATLKFRFAPHHWGVFNHSASGVFGARAVEHAVLLVARYRVSQLPLANQSL